MKRFLYGIRCRLIHVERRLRVGPLDAKWGDYSWCAAASVCWWCCESNPDLSCPAQRAARAQRAEELEVPF